MSSFRRLGILSLVVVAQAAKNALKTRSGLLFGSGTVVLEPWRCRPLEYVCIDFHKTCVDKFPDFRPSWSEYLIDTSTVSIHLEYFFDNFIPLCS